MTNLNIIPSPILGYLARELSMLLPPLGHNFYSSSSCIVVQEICKSKSVSSLLSE
jgi:hypothetical protein